MNYQLMYLQAFLAMSSLTLAIAAIVVGPRLYREACDYSANVPVYNELTSKGYSSIDILRHSLAEKNKALEEVVYSNLSTEDILEELRVSYKACDCDIVSSLLTYLVGRKDDTGVVMWSEVIARFLMNENLLGLCPVSELQIENDLKRVLIVFEFSLKAKEGTLTSEEFEEFCDRRDESYSQYLKNIILLITMKNSDTAKYDLFLKIATQYNSHLHSLSASEFVEKLYK